jgi:hypothetical protein
MEQHAKSGFCSTKVTDEICDSTRCPGSVDVEAFNARKTIARRTNLPWRVCLHRKTLVLAFAKPRLRFLRQIFVGLLVQI